MLTKICKECLVEKPTERFPRSKKNTDGFCGRCRDCVNAATRKRRTAKIEETRAKNREFYMKNREEINKQRREKNSIPENRIKIREYMREYIKDPIKNERKLESHRRSYLKHKDKNKEQKKARRRAYDKRRRTEPEFRLKDNMRRRLRSFLRGHPKPTTTFKLVGCSPNELVQHLEKQFLPGMTWENYGKEWHVDHIVMLQEFSIINEEELRLAFHYTNLRPLWVFDNVCRKFNIPRDQTVL